MALVYKQFNLSSIPTIDGNFSFSFLFYCIQSDDPMSALGRTPKKLSHCKTPKAPLDIKKIKCKAYNTTC